MSEINNSETFKQAIKNLECAQQRKLAALFVANVQSLSDDDRISRIIAVAATGNPSADELELAVRSAKAAIIESHTRCGAEGDWKEQASYFVARAAAAAVAPDSKCTSGGGAALQAATSCRMARTCAAIDSNDGNEEGAIKNESEQEFRILTEFLNSNT